MQNMVGRTGADIDIQIQIELRAAGILAVHTDRLHRSEVHYSYTGRLGPYTFERAWRYWIVDGKVPLAVASEIYANPVGKESVRAGGHCGCMDPKEYGSSIYTKNGKQVCPVKDWDQITHFMEKQIIGWDGLAPYVKAGTPEAEGAEAAVDTYHIDTQEGLEFFVETIKNHKLHEPKNREVLLEKLEKMQHYHYDCNEVLAALSTYVGDAEITTVVKKLFEEA